MPKFPLQTPTAAMTPATEMFQVVFHPRMREPLLAWMAAQRFALADLPTYDGEMPTFLAVPRSAPGE